MSDHFFFISKKKHMMLYRSLVLLNIFCTVAIISLTYLFTERDFMEQKMHVMQEFLEIDDMSRYSFISDMATLHTFLNSTIEVG